MDGYGLQVSDLFFRLFDRISPMMPHDIVFVHFMISIIRQSFSIQLGQGVSDTFPQNGLLCFQTEKDRFFHSERRNATPWLITETFSSVDNDENLFSMLLFSTVLIFFTSSYREQILIQSDSIFFELFCPY